MNSLCGITAWHHLCPTYQLCCHGKHDELLLTYFCATRRTPAGTLFLCLEHSQAEAPEILRHVNQPHPTTTNHIEPKMLGIIPAPPWYTLRDDSVHTHTHSDVVRTDTPASLHPITRLVSVAWQGFVGKLTAKVAS